MNSMSNYMKTWMALSERNLATRKRTIKLIDKYASKGEYKKVESLLNFYDLVVEDGKELFGRV